MVTKFIDRGEKAKLLGVDISGHGNRTRPLGTILFEAGIWKWNITRKEGNEVHSLHLAAEDPMAFGVWLHSENHITLLKCKPTRWLPAEVTCTTDEWLRIAKSTHGKSFEGIYYVELRVEKIHRKAATDTDSQLQTSLAQRDIEPMSVTPTSSMPTTLPAPHDPTAEIIMTLFTRLNTQSQGTLLQNLMKVWAL